MNDSAHHLGWASENGKPPVGREVSIRRDEQQSKDRPLKVPGETDTYPEGNEYPEKSFSYSSTKPLENALRPVDVYAFGG